MTRSARTLAVPILAVAAGLLGAAASRAAAPDWSALSTVGTIQIASTDPDGAKRDTTVWLVVVDGQGYVRTGGTRWGDNLERDPAVVARIEGVEHPLRAERVTDPALLERLSQAFRDKYGAPDAILSIFRGSSPRLFRLVPAASLAAR
jgi:hypothetical protein